ncbi:MAG TPA: hypothetical protein VF074_10085 [Pyrinomonadaceae bacterium]
MKVNEELQKETNTTEVLSDLSVSDEEASKTSGGAVNFAAIKLDYKEQKPD